MSTDRRVLLHPYAPGVWPERQQATWEALAAVSKVFRGRVWDLACTAPDVYATMLNMLAMAGTSVVVVEHDIVPTVSLVSELLACAAPVCAHDYRVGPGVNWADIPGALGLGLAKVTGAAWDAITERPRVPIVSWDQVAGELATRLPPVHVHHGKVVHNHPY
jgi:hypothetical protein